MAIIEADFTGVTSGAGFLEPGTYRAEVENVAQVEGRNYPGLKWTWRSVEPVAVDRSNGLVHAGHFLLKVGVGRYFIC